MSRYTNPTVRGALSSHTIQPGLQTIAEAATSRISLAPPAAGNSDTITAIPTRPHTPEMPTDEEIEAALADARESDPSGQNDSFYYTGYQSRENLADVPELPTRGGDELLGGEARMHYHSVDNTWRLYPPTFDFPEVSDDGNEGEEGETSRQRKRDKLRRLGISLYKRVSALRKSRGKKGGDGGAGSASAN